MAVDEDDYIWWDLSFGGKGEDSGDVLHETFMTDGGLRFRVVASATGLGAGLGQWVSMFFSSPSGPVQLEDDLAMVVGTDGAIRRLLPRGTVLPRDATFGEARLASRKQCLDAGLVSPGQTLLVGVSRSWRCRPFAPLTRGGMHFVRVHFGRRASCVSQFSNGSLRFRVEIHVRGTRAGLTRGKFVSAYVFCETAVVEVLSQFLVVLAAPHAPDRAAYVRCMGGGRRIGPSGCGFARLVGRDQALAEGLVGEDGTLLFAFSTDFAFAEVFDAELATGAAPASPAVKTAPPRTPGTPEQSLALALPTQSRATPISRRSRTRTSSR